MKNLKDPYLKNLYLSNPYLNDPYFVNPYLNFLCPLGKMALVQYLEDFLYKLNKVLEESQKLNFPFLLSMFFLKDFLFPFSNIINGIRQYVIIK